MQQELKLKISEQRYEFALEASSEGIWDLDVKTNQVFFSSQSMKMLGFEEKDSIMSIDKWDNRIHPDDIEKYKKDIKEYYYTIKNKNLTQLLSNPDVYKDQPEIYKRMKLSYFFEGRSKTLKTFSPIKDKIPYKFKYDIIKDSLKSPLEFLKDGMDYR